MLDDRMALTAVLTRWARDRLRRHPALDALERATRELPDGGMMTDPGQADVLAFLVELVGAKLVVEVGTFTGYGTLAMALALPPDGRVITLDVGDWGGLGDRYWAMAGVADRVERRLGLAEVSLDVLLAGPEAGRADLVYIDADKRSYPRYLEQALRLVRPGGVIALDNVFWGGAVADERDGRPQTDAIRSVVERCRADPGLGMTLLPIADGLMLLRRR